MTNSSNDMALGQEAAQQAKDIAIANIRQIKASVINRPAWGTKLTAAQRVTQHRQFLDNPLAMSEEYDAVSQRFQVPPGHVPTRFGDYGVLAQRDLANQEGQA